MRHTNLMTLELRGLLLSFLLLLAAVAAFGTGSLGFLNRTGEKESGNTA